MSPRMKTLAWLLGLAALAVAAFLAGRYFPLAPAPDTAPVATDEPAPPAWDFEWRDGDVRGIDVPSHVRVGNQRVPMRHLADMQSPG